MSNNPIATYVAQRWYGHTPVWRLFWRDLLGVGTLINMVFVFVTLLLYAKRVEPAWAMAVHLAPLPFNLFLVGAVWRHRAAPTWAKATALGWLGLTVVG